MTDPIRKPSAEFDAYATDYEQMVQGAIGASGESVQFFAALKARLMRRALANEQPRRILDFGCGVGNATRELARCFPTAEIVGVDPSSESLEIAKRRYAASGDNIAFRQSEPAKISAADGAFDAAFVSGVFHHIEPADRVGVARELHRVLAPGAPLFISEHNPYNPLTRHVVRNVPFDEGVVLLRPPDARAVLEKAGFIAESANYYFFFPALLRALRPLERFLTRLPLGGQYFMIGRTPT